MPSLLLPFIPDAPSENYWYVLVDCALLKGFYLSLSQIDNLRYKSLFLGTSEASSAEVGPVLIELKPAIHSSFISTLVTYQTEYETPIWLQTPIAFTPLFNTLRKLLYVEKEDGSQHFFRYYDHQCFAGFWSIASKNPYYIGTLCKTRWAIWQSSQQHYQYNNDYKIGNHP
ncbi:DUF4123 domain-containing protein [Gilliamella intestini]|uniref:DUF4123 domain-containing protein n=1 Tax=Gilliamella intestini TaxID=1798183 RepID=A0A1C4BK99_9GAMM|nr:DUF4123 domain-containing protein [Gilliamella intestini]SCC07361.1 protein of unknown function [Gilliamella intestini]